MNSSRAEDRLADFTRDRRVIILSLMAVAVGATSALVADALVWLIEWDEAAGRRGAA